MTYFAPWGCTVSYRPATRFGGNTLNVKAELIDDLEDRLADYPRLKARLDWIRSSRFTLEDLFREVERGIDDVVDLEVLRARARRSPAPQHPHSIIIRRLHREENVGQTLTEAFNYLPDEGKLYVVDYAWDNCPLQSNILDVVDMQLGDKPAERRLSEDNIIDLCIHAGFVLFHRGAVGEAVVRPVAFCFEKPKKTVGGSGSAARPIRLRKPGHLSL